MKKMISKADYDTLCFLMFKNSVDVYGQHVIRLKEMRLLLEPLVEKEETTPELEVKE
jgi:hypothetical protein